MPSTRWAMKDSRISFWRISSVLSGPRQMISTPCFFASRSAPMRAYSNTGMCSAFGMNANRNFRGPSECEQPASNTSARTANDVRID